MTIDEKQRSTLDIIEERLKSIPDLEARIDSLLEGSCPACQGQPCHHNFIMHWLITPVLALWR
jgi:hypothetical protein